MTTRAEQMLLEHLNDPESLDYLSREGLLQPISLAVVPTELIRKITAWSLAYFWENGRKVGPSREATLEVWGDRMEAMEIAFGEPTEEIDSIEGSLATLRDQYVVSQSQKINKEMATKVLRADPRTKIAALAAGTQAFHQLLQSVSSRRQESEAGAGFDDVLLRYEDRRIDGRHLHGMTLGIDLIDNHTLGIHPGEIAVFAMTSGGGKSWLAGSALLNEWQRGRRAVLVTLENDLEMTFDRLACLLARVDYTKLQRSEANNGEIDRVFEWADRLKSSDHQPVVTMIQANERDPESIVRRCHVLGGESLIIDQLTYVERVPGTKSRERHQQVAEIMRALHEQVRDEANGKLPLLLMHQINREGRAAARKTGRYEFEHFGLSTEVENIASHVWAAYQSEDQKALQRASWQTLKFRRGVPLDWDMRWRLDVGDIRALNVAEPVST